MGTVLFGKRVSVFKKNKKEATRYSERKIASAREVSSRLFLKPALGEKNASGKMAFQMETLKQCLPGYLTAKGGLTHPKSCNGKGVVASVSCVSEIVSLKRIP